MAEQIFVSPNGSASLVAGANITLSSGSGQITIIGGVNAGATTFLAGVSTDGNTAGTTGVVNNQIEFVGGNNITLSQSKNLQSATISVVGPNLSQSFGMSNLGNTDGTSGMASAANVQFVLVGGNNISLSQSLNVGSGGGTITINGPNDDDPFPAELILPVASDNASGTMSQVYAMGDHQHRGVFSAGISTDGNTAGITGIYPCELVLVGGTNITLSQSVNSTNGLTISIMGNTDGTLSQWAPINYGGNTTFQQIGQATLKVFPIFLQHFGSFSFIDNYVSVSHSTGGGTINTNFSGSASLSFGVYTKNGSSLSLASSGSASYSWKASGTSFMSLYTGMRHMSIPIGLSMNPGNYWVGLMSSTTFSSRDNCTISNFGNLIAPGWVNDFGSAVNATNQFMVGIGAYSTTTNALPAVIGISELVGSQTSTMVPYMNFLDFDF
jgi:hypothetical protein